MIDFSYENLFSDLEKAFWNFADKKISYLEFMMNSFIIHSIFESLNYPVKKERRVLYLDIVKIS